MNGIKTVVLLGALSGLLLLGGEALGGRNGLVMGLGLAIAMNFFSYFFSEKIALSMYSAQRVSETENPQIWRRIGPMTRNLCERMGIPMPKLWIIPDHSPNAFATGRNPSHSSVAVTAGILELMNDRETEAVIAHELGHIKNRDILISSIAATIAAAVTMLARLAWFIPVGRSDDEESGGGGLLGGMFMLFLAPVAAMLIQMAISRTREFSADATAAKYTGGPDGMMSALARLDTASKQIPLNASPATAHMFTVRPFLGGIGRLFSTHPPTEERIARLRARTA